MKKWKTGKKTGNKRRKPENDKFYYIINSENHIEEELWKNDNIDIVRYNNYNIFLTEEEAEKAQRVRETENLLRKYVEEHDTEEIDWNNQNKGKWYISYDYRNKKISFGWIISFKNPRIIYSANEETLINAIKKIGKDRIVEYTKY